MEVSNVATDFCQLEDMVLCFASRYPSFRCVTLLQNPATIRFMRVLVNGR